MGTFGTGSFGNDTAMDFVDSLDGFDEIPRTLNHLNATAGEIDVDTASSALAACDILAACLGRPSADVPDLPDFSDAPISDELLRLARSVIAQVRERSELAELWAGDDEWQAELDELVLRLTPPEPFVSPEKPKKPDLPDDFVGHCYLCHDMVTARDGIVFEHSMELGGTFRFYPHRRCVEAKIPGPHWQADGTPTPSTRLRLLRDMGFDV